MTMATELKKVDCPEGVYTALSSGQANVSFRPPLVYGGRMAWGTSLPDPATEDFEPIAGGEHVSLGSMTGVNVYWKPNTAATAIKVMRG
jgi:hypothetical protein